MNRKTHESAGSLITIFKVLTTGSIICILGVLGSMAPDVDQKIKGMKHRGVSHTLLALFITSSIIVYFNKEVGEVWFLCYLSHLILDSITIMGVPLLWPLSKKYYGLKLIKTGGTTEKLFPLIMTVLTVLFVLRYFSII